MADAALNNAATALATQTETLGALNETLQGTVGAMQPRVIIPTFGYVFAQEDQKDKRDQDKRPIVFLDYIAQFEQQLILLGIVDNEKKKAQLLAVGGADFIRADIEMPNPEVEDGNPYTVLKAKLQQKFGKPQQLAERLRFERESTQRSSEDFMDFYHRLLRLLRHCEYTEDEKNMILHQRLLSGTTVEPIRLKAIRDNQNLDAVIASGFAHVLATEQSSYIRGTQRSNEHVKEGEVVNKVFHKNRSEGRPCSCCDRIHRKNQCPAFGLDCNSCGKKNHFAIACRTPQEGNQTQTRGYQSSRGGKRDNKNGKSQWRNRAVNEEMTEQMTEDTTYDSFESHVSLHDHV
jgi:hypothetical protein